jgi:hypothetical protein
MEDLEVGAGPQAVEVVAAVLVDLVARVVLLPVVLEVLEFKFQ